MSANVATADLLHPMPRGASAADRVASLAMSGANRVRTFWNGMFQQASTKARSWSDNAFTRAAADHYEERGRVLALQRMQLEAGSSESNALDVGRKVLGGAGTYGMAVRSMGYTAAAAGAIPLALPAAALIARTSASIADIAFKAATDRTRTRSTEERSATYETAVAVKQGVRGWLNAAVRKVDGALTSFQERMDQSSLPPERRATWKQAASALAARQREELRMCADDGAMRVGALAAYGAKSVFGAGAILATGLLTFNPDALGGASLPNRITLEDAAAQVNSTRMQLGELLSPSLYAAEPANDELIVLPRSDDAIVLPRNMDTIVLQRNESTVTLRRNEDIVPERNESTVTLRRNEDLITPLSASARNEEAITLPGAAPQVADATNGAGSGAIVPVRSGAAPDLTSTAPAASSDVVAEATVQRWRGRGTDGSVSEVARKLASQNDALPAAQDFRAAMREGTLNGAPTNLWDLNHVHPGTTVRLVETADGGHRFEVTTHDAAPMRASGTLLVEQAPAPAPSTPVEPPSPVQVAEAAPIQESATSPTPLPGVTDTVTPDGERTITQHVEARVRREIHVDGQKVRVETRIDGGPPQVEQFTMRRGETLRLPTASAEAHAGFTLRNGVLEPLGGTTAGTSVDVIAPATAAPAPVDAPLTAAEGELVPQGSTEPLETHVAPTPVDPIPVEPAPAPLVEAAPAPAPAAAAVETSLQEIDARGIGLEHWSGVWDAVREDPAMLRQLLAYEERLGAEGTDGDLTNTAILRLFQEQGIRNVPLTGEAEVPLHMLLSPDEQRTLQQGMVSLLQRATTDDLRTPEHIRDFVARELAAR